MRLRIAQLGWSLGVAGLLGCHEPLPDHWATAEPGPATDSEPLSTGLCSVDTTHEGCLDTDTDVPTTSIPVDTGDTQSHGDSETEEYPEFCGNLAYLPYAEGPGYPFDRAGAPVRGNPDAAEVVIDLYAYFYCSHCKDAAAFFEALYLDPTYAERTTLYFGHYAFSDDLEASVWDPHRAAHAAHRQGRFWDMHDALFEGSGPYDEVALRTIAQGLGLDLALYAADYDSAATSGYLAADRTEVKAAGATGTPATFVNGIAVTPWTEVKPIVDCLLGL